LPIGGLKIWFGNVGMFSQPGYAQGLARASGIIEWYVTKGT